MRTFCTCVLAHVNRSTTTIEAIGNTGDEVTERGLIPGSGEQNKEQSEVDYTGMRFSSTYDAGYVFFPFTLSPPDCFKVLNVVVGC